MKQPIVCTLGRYGDIINALPIALQLSKDSGQQTKFVVAKEFWSILDGCKYIKPVVWDVKYNELEKVFPRLSANGVVVCQSHRHPDQKRLTESYQKEAWRLAGWLDKFGTLPLVFDNRNEEREIALAKELFGPLPLKKKLIIFSGKSVSSPFSFVPFLNAINNEFLKDYWVLNISDLMAQRIYDILGLFDMASVIVTVDTMHLHMASACKTPVIAIINEGWLGSVPPKNTFSTFRYSQANPKLIVDSINELMK